MKIFYCLRCHDIRKVKRREQFCDCRASKAKSLNNMDIVIGGDAVPINVDDSHLAVGALIWRREKKTCFINSWTVDVQQENQIKINKNQ